MCVWEVLGSPIKTTQKRKDGKDWYGVWVKDLHSIDRKKNRDDESLTLYRLAGYRPLSRGLIGLPCQPDDSMWYPNGTPNSHSLCIVVELCALPLVICFFFSSSSLLYFCPL